MKRLITTLAACLMGFGCTSGPISATPETPLKALRTVSYDINIPYQGIVIGLKATYPNGFEGTPIEAQNRWNYTAEYVGSPNVYFGDTAPGCYQYLGTGILVAPRRVVTLQQFTSVDWPVLEPGYTYSWRGNFVYTRIADPASYVPGPAGCK